MPDVDGQNAPGVTPLMRLRHKLHIAWLWAKGKKRLTSIVLSTAGNIALLTGNAPLGGALLGLGSIIGGVALTEKAGEKLNKSTSGDKINWKEVIEAFFRAVRRIAEAFAARPKM